MRVNPTVSLTLLLLVMAAILPGQANPIVGSRDITFANTGPKGSPNLATTIYYPAVVTELGLKVRPQKQPFSGVVFLHGYGALGRCYYNLGQHLAAEGYLAILCNTGQFSATDQVADGIALFHALKAAAGTKSHFLYRRLDPQRLALIGHSMGGGGVFAALADNPGYRAGLALAPLRSKGIANTIRVPVGLIHGEGDRLVGWHANSGRLFNQTTRYGRLKFLYLMGKDCNHYNLSGNAINTDVDFKVWYRVTRLISAFLDCFLCERIGALEEIVGVMGRADPLLSRLRVKVRSPILWASPDRRVGFKPRLSLLSGQGGTLIFGSLGIASLATSFGRLQLDPTTMFPITSGAQDNSKFLTVSLPYAEFPIAPATPLVFQALGINDRKQVKFSNLLKLSILP